jgi:hypothetical protein
MVMAALTALKSTNDDFGIEYSCGYWFMKNGCGELSRIQREAYPPPEKSVGGQICQNWQVYCKAGNGSAKLFCCVAIKLVSEAENAVASFASDIKNMKDHADAMAIAHQVQAHEDFERTAQILLALLNKAQREHPGIKRCLYLEIDGHRNSEGRFDSDMFELQSKFMGEFLIQFLTRAESPLGAFRNPNPQNDEIPERLDLIKFDRPPTGGPDEFKVKR